MLSIGSTVTWSSLVQLRKLERTFSMHTGFVFHLSLSTQKCWLIIVPSNVFTSADQSNRNFCMWFYTVIISSCAVEWCRFLYGEVAYDMRTGGMGGLLACYIAWSWQLQQGTKELEKINTAGCTSAMVRSLSACASWWSKDSLLPSAPGSFVLGGVPWYPFSALAVLARALALLSRAAYLCFPWLDVRGVSCCSNPSASFQTW